jgi:hypothetical protein
MAKPQIVDVTDDHHVPKRKFKCNKKNVFRIIGNEFDDDAMVELKDPQGAGKWINPPIGVVPKTHKRELEVTAQCNCGRSPLLDFFLRLIWPLLRLFGLVSRRHWGIGSLTVTVTNPSGGSDTVPYPDNSITYE